MKTNIYKLFLAVVLISCGGGSDGPEENSAPTIPVQKTPTNEFASDKVKIEFTWWASTDAEADAMSYVLQIAEDDQFSSGLKTISNITGTSIQVDLVSSTAYYWRIKAVDDEQNESAYSDVSVFYTDGYRVGNQIPSAPVLMSPTNNFLCSVNNVDFGWEASTDGDGDAITYTIEVTKDEQFNSIDVTIGNISSTLKQIDLLRATTYYWRVKATDETNESSAYSSIYKFYTEGYGVENHLPNTPGLVFPELSETVNGNTIILKWTALDQDVNDILSYDVFVGTANPPTEKIGIDLSKKEFEFSPLITNTTYYWKVVVKDNHDGASIGQVWDFKTE
jgi:hypothetical protein